MFHPFGDGCPVPPVAHRADPIAHGRAGIGGAQRIDPIGDVARYVAFAVQLTVESDQRRARKDAQPGGDLRARPPPQGAERRRARFVEHAVDVHTDGLPELIEQRAHGGGVGARILRHALAVAAVEQVQGLWTQFARDGTFSESDGWPVFTDDRPSILALDVELSLIEEFRDERCEALFENGLIPQRGFDLNLTP